MVVDAVRAPTLVEALHVYFESWWVRGHDADPAHDQAGTMRSSGEDKALPQLLADGMKDENLARRLGLSVRTVRRRISDLMGRLEAGSRFQAGVQAVRNRWI